jgi:hypothetical protein
MDGRRRARHGRATGGALAPVLVGRDRFAQQLEHPRRRARSPARDQARDLHDIDEALVRQSERADPSLLGTPGCGQAGRGGGRDAPVQVGRRHFQQARKFDRFTHRMPHAFGAVGPGRHFRGAQVHADGQCQRREFPRLGPRGKAVGELHRLMHGQDGRMQAALGMVGLPRVGGIGEDRQDGVGTALGDLAAQLDDCVRKDVTHFIDERSEFGGRQRLAGRGKVVQARIEEGRDSERRPFAVAAFPGLDRGRTELRQQRRLGRGEFGRGELGFFERHAATITKNAFSNKWFPLVSLDIDPRM